MCKCYTLALSMINGLDVQILHIVMFVFGVYEYYASGLCVMVIFISGICKINV